jgi:hypothetical protein
MSSRHIDRKNEERKKGDKNVKEVQQFLRVPMSASKDEDEEERKENKKGVIPVTMQFYKQKSMYNHLYMQPHRTATRGEEGGEVRGEVWTGAKEKIYISTQSDSHTTTTTTTLPVCLSEIIVLRVCVCVCGGGGKKKKNSVL